MRGGGGKTEEPALHAPGEGETNAEEPETETGLSGSDSNSGGSGEGEAAPDKPDEGEPAPGKPGGAEAFPGGPDEGETAPDKPADGDNTPDESGGEEVLPSDPGETETDLGGQDGAELSPDEAGEGETGEGDSGAGDPSTGDPGTGETTPEEETVTIRFAPSDGGDMNYTVLWETTDEAGEVVSGEVEEISVKKGSSAEIKVTLMPKNGYVIRNVPTDKTQPVSLMYKNIDGDKFSFVIRPPRQSVYTGDAVIKVDVVEQTDVTLSFQRPETSGLEEINVQQQGIRSPVEYPGNTATISNRYTAGVLIKTSEGKIPFITYDGEIHEYGDIVEGYYAFSLTRTFSDRDIAITLKDGCQVTFETVDANPSIDVVSIIEDSDYEGGRYADQIRELNNNTTMAVTGEVLYFRLTDTDADGLGITVSIETEAGEKIQQYMYDAEMGETVYGFTPESDTKIMIKGNPKVIPIFYADGAVSDIEVIEIDGTGPKIADDKKSLLAFATGKVKLRFMVAEGKELNRAVIYYTAKYEDEEDYTGEIDVIKTADGVYETSEGFTIVGNLNKLAVFGSEKVDQAVKASIPKSSISVGEAAVITAEGFGELTYSSSNPDVAAVSKWGRVTGVTEGEAEITVNAAGDNDFNPGSATFTVKVTPAESEFILYGAAEKLSDGSIQLTPDECDRKGSVWHRDRIGTADGFTVTFSYWAGAGDVADGIVLMLSEETGLGGEGDGVSDEGGGLAFLPGSYGVEFDSYYNEGDDGSRVVDPTEKKHIAIVKEGVTNHLKWVPDERVADGQWHEVSVIYSASTLRVLLDGEKVLPSKGDEEKVEVRLPDIIYVGLSAATGDCTNTHLVKNLSAHTGATPDDPINPTDPAEKRTVTFDYPETVSVNAEGYTLTDNKITVESGKSISFKVSLNDENFEIKSVKANGADLSIDASTGSYVLTVSADTQIVISAEKKQTGTDPTDPTDPSDPEVSKDGLAVVLTGREGYDTQKDGYVYTGNAITPEVAVYYNGVKRRSGVDYTVKYANNINVSESAKVTITGKGDLSGKYEKTYKIIPKNIGDADVEAGAVRVVKNSKATPVLAYSGKLLSAKDYTISEPGKKFTADGSIIIDGKGNFEGKRTIPVQVVDNKSALNKISIRLDNNKNKNLVYDGKKKYPVFDVLDAQKNVITKEEGTSYIVVYPNDITSAGTVKFTVVGIGAYTGSVTKSYKIKPSAVAGRIDVSEPDRAGYPFVSTGVTQYRPEVNTTVDGTRIKLTENKDYTLKYSNNKKAGTAKCKVSFMGNYKGTQTVTKEFTINAAKMDDFINLSAGEIIIPDKDSKGKEGIYKSVPYMIEKGTGADVLLKSSAFNLTYYVKGDPRVSGSGAVEMKGRDGRIAEGTVWVKIAPKNANYTGAPVYVSYEVRNGGSDLSKAKVTFMPSKTSYTGKQVTEKEVTCSVVLNGKEIYNSKTNKDPKISVSYVNNVNKGKATVIVTGNGIDYTGAKTATFTIAASDIKNNR